MKLGFPKFPILVFAASIILGPAAYAMEHEFHGRLLVKGTFSNFDQAGGNDASKTPNELTKGNFAKSFFYVEQRARLRYVGKFTNDVRLVTQFEIDSRWGDTSQDVGRNRGGAMETDQVNLETKNVYMEFKVPFLPTVAKVGTIPFDDAYKGVFLSSDIAGAMTSTRRGATTLNLGWLRGYDNKNFNGAGDNLFSGVPVPIVPGGTQPAVGSGGSANSAPGRYSLDVGILEAKHRVSKDLSVGGSYYLIYDNLNNKVNMLHTFGVNASAVLGPADVDGFVLFQTGKNPTNNFGQVSQNVSAFAANLAARVKTGPGTLRASVLYASGDDGQGSVHAFQGVNQLGQGNTTSTYSAAQMTMLITNTKYASNTDRALINTVSNYDQGVIGGFLGYDMVFGKVFVKGNLGGASAARENRTFKPKNRKTNGYNGNYEGTELNAEVGYQVSENLTASAVGGYLWLGDYWKDTATRNGTIVTPDNPWKTQLVMNLTF